MENRNILVIEDNELNMKLMRGVFRIGKYQMIEAYDAETGIHLAREHQPFLILMDIQLPDIDGLEVAKRIRASEVDKDTPIIAVTSYAMPGDKEKIMEAGCNGYLSKPINVDEFMKEVAKHL